ncbi:MAG: 50S ribosomal protein L18Ae [Methanosarcinaceae archaeon]
MKNYIIKGTFKAGHKWETFTKNLESQNAKNAQDKVYSIFGSKHNIKRFLIKIDSVTEA